MVPVKHSVQIFSFDPLTAVEHHVQHIVLRRCSAFLCGKALAGSLDHDLHHEPIHAVQLFDIEISLQGEQRNCGGDSRLFPHAFCLRPGLPHADPTDGKYLIALGGCGIALDSTCHDPTQIDHLRAGVNLFSGLRQRKGGKPCFLCQQLGVALGAAGIGGINDRVHKILFSKNKTQRMTDLPVSTAS